VSDYLDELDRLYRESRPGRWRTEAGNPYRIWSREKGFDLPVGSIKFVEDAAFIAAAHNAYPTLAAELRAARALIEALLTGPEWQIGADERTYCPFCGGKEPGVKPRKGWYTDQPEQYEIDLRAWEERGHKSDCPRQVALAAYRKTRGEE
jgi:hypothetical protein